MDDRQEKTDLFMKMPVSDLMTSEWDSRRNKDRDYLMESVIRRTIEAPLDKKDTFWPSSKISERERVSGLYPDPADPRFAARLYEKREFHEARAVAASVAEGLVDPCTSAAAEALFELTPIQRIVSRFLHPLTPYMGLLLYHGVGVGKTCSAVTIAEQFLESSPNTKVIVLAPQALKDNFKQTIFDPAKLVWDKRWTARQCTGTSYLERLNLMDNPDLQSVINKVNDDRRKRYTITGYQAFSNWIKQILANSVPIGLVDPVTRLTAENEVLRRLFSDHLIIIDEAHNLRDLTEHDDESTVSVGENQAGKSLNPYLSRIVLNAEGLRLVLMTATPMYNSAPEIMLLLNYLIMNDRKSNIPDIILKSDALFTKDGGIKDGLEQRKLEKAVRAYVSYMRGENPFTFPLRMRPLESTNESSSTKWLDATLMPATKLPIVLSDGEIEAICSLPIVFSEPISNSPNENKLRSATSRGRDVDDEDNDKPTGDAMLDSRMQIANFTYPNSMSGSVGFDNYFSTQTKLGGPHALKLYKPNQDFPIDSVFSVDTLQPHAPKIHSIIKRVISAKGICFIYSRYIKAGVLLIAIALERAGFQRRLADGTIHPILTGVPPVAPVCAICNLTQDRHVEQTEHTFYPACYVLLTADDDITPNFPGLIRQATSVTNGMNPMAALGTNVKVIIGTQVASEGIDLKCIREIHILDSWYHLNRTDQIIGRAIRYCSHTALRNIETITKQPIMSLNNCLIYLHVTYVPKTDLGPAIETADMFAYRIAIRKALHIGKVQRILKRHAWDCNLELEAITFAGLPSRTQIDAQGNTRGNEDGSMGYDINDQDYTSYCDYQVCKHECAVTLSDVDIDSSSFGISDARQIILAKQDIVRHLFNDQIMVPESIIKDLFKDLPWEISSRALMELIDGRRFYLTRPDGVRGFLVKKANFIVFQPSLITDTETPMTLRYARGFQLTRHYMTPTGPVLGLGPGPGPGQGPGPSVASAYASPGTGPGPGPGPSVASALGLNQEWGQWVDFVISNGTAKLPENIPKLWSWILNRYRDVQTIRRVAYRWWFDKIATFDQQKKLIESNILEQSTNNYKELLLMIVSNDILMNNEIIAYRILNPETKQFEYYKRDSNSHSFIQCSSSLSALIEKQLGTHIVQIPADTGNLIGFLSPKTDKCVFKTFDTTMIRTQSSVGAECGISSNLIEHHIRVKKLHIAGLQSVLSYLMLPDSDDSWVSSASKQNMINNNPQHMKDITHQPLCLYMEFLTRIFDTESVMSKRWFLSAIEAIHSGLRGKVVKKT